MAANGARVRTALALILLLAAVGRAEAQFNITGTATNPSAAPVPNVEIRLFTSGGIAIGIPITITGAGGTYAINGLPSGSYVVEFRPPAPSHLLPVRLPVTIAGAHATLNAPLLAGFLLSGYVRDQGGIGIAAIDLQVRDRRTRELLLTPNDDTDLTGFYQVVVPAGEYDLEWRAVAVGSLPWIPVTARERIDADIAIDVTMLLGVFVSGTVTGYLGAPVANVNLDFIDQATGLKALTPGDVTQVDGTFTAQVPVGVYTVLAKPLPADHLTAVELMDVNIAADMSGLDISLPPGQLLSGVVSGPGGLPVEGVDIDLVNEATGAKVTLAYDVTDVNGAYQVVAPVGTYEVTVSAPVATGLASKRIAGTALISDAVLNIALANGALLTGTVTAGGAPVAGVDIDVIDPVTGASLPLVGDGTGANGVYATLVPPGTWHVEFEPPLATGLLARRLLGQAVPGTTNLSVALTPGVRVTGTVTSALGAPVAGVNVDARRMSDLVEVFTPGDHTNALGIYQMVVPADTYRLVFKPGLPYAAGDSIVLDNQVVTVDRVIDVSLPGASAVEGSPPYAFGIAALRAEPNPFNPTTDIRFTLDAGGHARVSVYGIDGRAVRMLHDGDAAAGPRQYRWDGRDDAGREVPSGVYLAVVVSGGEVSAAKMLLLK